MEGEMAPEETVPFVVTLQASVHASFYGVDLICKVYRQELMRQYHRELQEWENEKKRQEEEFIITDRKVKPRAFCTACEPVRRYKTLPPITNQQPSSRPASWNLRMMKEEPLWLCPQPPTPAILCLSLTARTHSIDYYLTNFFSEFPRHFLHWEPPKKKSLGEESEAYEEEAVTEEEEPIPKQMKQLLVDCLTAIIRGLLEDRNFHEAVDQNLVEEVPYFCQFWSEKSAQTMAPYSSLYLMPIMSLTSVQKDQGMSQQSLQGQWKQNLKLMMKEEQEQDEKEAIGRLPAFANLQEALLENMIQNVLVEASFGEVVLTSRPRIITLPPVNAPPPRTDVLPSPLPPEQPAEEASSVAADPTTESLPIGARVPSTLPSTPTAKASSEEGRALRLRNCQTPPPPPYGSLLSGEIRLPPGHPRKPPATPADRPAGCPALELGPAG
ncbi:cilia- and flagella-associated protein 65-like [Perognathus longimembris pacificus]|uniref:cilia- and flagella-associated protein 65-like n=1 Tax=Perognathus longimembris pacificus TaxID=214514 RepID=UPI002018B699|nr:cilia- and flagella-associated protein 65-like [Perognathus longimembris pacificus]